MRENRGLSESVSKRGHAATAAQPENLGIPGDSAEVVTDQAVRKGEYGVDDGFRIQPGHSLLAI
jgi:hypothetical protein